MTVFLSSSLLHTTSQWLLNIDRGKYNIAVSIDLRKAFDSVATMNFYFASYVTMELMV